MERKEPEGDYVVIEWSSALNCYEVWTFDTYEEALGYKGEHSGRIAKVMNIDEDKIVERDCSTCEWFEPHNGVWRNCSDCPLPDLPKWQQRSTING